MKLLGFSIVTLASSSYLHAAQDVDADATVMVSNVFSLAPVDDLYFGKIQATASSTAADVATLTIDPDGTIQSPVPGTEAEINIIEDGNPATFIVSQAAPNKTLTLTLPNSIDLISAGSSAKFTVDNFVTLITSGPNSGSSGSVYPYANLTTDINGSVEFAIGATLSTDSAGGAISYLDEAEYSGQFNVLVEY